MLRVWKESGNWLNRVVLVKGAVHAWDLQLPELFARAIIAWVEEKLLAEEITDL